MNKKFVLVLGFVALALLAIELSKPSRSSNVAKSTKARATSNQTDAKPIDFIVINACQSDPQNADMWRTTHINLFADPTLSNKRKTGEIPACASVTAEVLEKKYFDGVEFYKIKYKDQNGWQTRRLLTGGQ